MSSTKTVPTLLHLAHRRFARWLCVQQIKRTPLPADSPDYGPTYFESCETSIVEMLHQTYALYLPQTCLDAVRQYVHVIVDDMKRDLQDLGVVTLIGYTITAKKWRDLAAAWWSSCWQQAGETVFLAVFETVMRRSKKEGLCVVPEDDLATYLDVWHSAAKELKMNVFTNLLRAQTRKYRFGSSIRNLFDRPRNLEFVTILLADFDLETRLELWQQNWLELIVGISPTCLEPLMRLCTDNDRSFEQFKAVWLSNSEIIKSYYCALIGDFFFDKLNELLRFYSSDNCEVLHLSILTIRMYFTMNQLPQSYKHLHRISMSDGWLKKALETPELEYLWRTDDAKLRTHCYKLLADAEYHELTNFLRLFMPEKDARTLEKRYVESFFSENKAPFNSPHDWFSSQAFKKLPEFDEFIKRVFDSVDEATDLKKRFIYTPRTLDGLRIALCEYELSNLDDFVRLCLPSDREITEWEDTFLRDNIRSMRKTLTSKYTYKSYTRVISWCMSSQRKLAKFKSIISIDDVFEIVCLFNRSSTCVTYVSLDRFFALNQALDKWYSHLEDRIEYKLQKLRDYPDDKVVLRGLLGIYIDEFSHQDTEEQKRQVVAEALELD